MGKKAAQTVAGYVVGPKASYVNKGILYGPGDPIPPEIFADKDFFASQVKSGNIIPTTAEVEGSADDDSGSGSATGATGAAAGSASSGNQ